MTTQHYEVVGMTCDHCVQAVETEVAKIAGVSEVRIDLPANTMSVDSDQPLAREEVVAALDEAGFDLRS